MSSCSWRSSTTCSVISWRRWSPDSRASAGHLVERLALHVDHVAQLLRDVVVDAAEVVLLELLLALAPQLLEHLAQAHELLAVAILEARLQHAPQGRVEVAVVEQVVGDLAEDVVGIELEPRLRAVPPRVAHPTMPIGSGPRTTR